MAHEPLWKMGWLPVVMTVVLVMAHCPSGVVSECGLSDCQDKPLYQCSLQDCSTVNLINLHSKNVWGTIPLKVGLDLDLVGKFIVSNNHLSGSIPASLGSWNMLTAIFALNGNNLTGTIPSSFGSLASKTTTSTFWQLNLAHNLLSGTIPSSLGSLSISSLFDLSYNALTGTIPDSLCDVVKNADVCGASTDGLSHNMFECPVSSTCVDIMTPKCGAVCTARTAPDTTTAPPTTTAPVTTTVPPTTTAPPTAPPTTTVPPTTTAPPTAPPTTTVPPTTTIQPTTTAPAATTTAPKCGYAACLAKPLYECHLEACTSSSKFYLYDANLYGTIPDTIVSLSDTMVQLYIHENQLSGSIPSALGSMGSMVEGLNAFGNLLSGTIPPSLGSLPVQTAFRLNDNNLTGVIPSSLCSLFDTLDGVCNLAGDFMAFTCPLPEACASELTTSCGAQCTVGVGSWTSWSACSTSCGAGSQYREYIVGVEASQNAVRECLNNQACPVDCAGEWGTWSDCPVTCGFGNIARLFNVMSPASNGGACPAPMYGSCYTQECQPTPAPTTAAQLTTSTPSTTTSTTSSRSQSSTTSTTLSNVCAGEWGAWSACSSKCGVGNVWRNFDLSALAVDNGMCPSPMHKSCLGEDCSPSPAPIAVTYSEIIMTRTSTLLTLAGTTLQPSTDAVTSAAQFFTNSTSKPASTISPLYLPFGESTTAVRVGLSIAIVAVIVAVVVVGVVCARRRRTLRKITHQLKLAKSHSPSQASLALLANDGASGPTPDQLMSYALSKLSTLLQKPRPPQWSNVEKIVEHIAAYQDACEDFSRRNSIVDVDDFSSIASDGLESHAGEHITAEKEFDNNPLVGLAIDVLQGVLAEHQVLLDGAISARDYDSMTFYTARVKWLSEALPPLEHQTGPVDLEQVGTGNSNTENNCIKIPRAQSAATMECVVPGLLLSKDRFEGTSQAFLGRGASAAVSRGVLVEVLGSTEVRSTVAVKEVPKTGAASEKQAMRELLLLKKKLREVHPNIVQVLDVRSSSSMFYVIMQFCSFSLDRQPSQFQDFLHSCADSAEGSSIGSIAHRKRDRAGTTNFTGKIVLNALVQDLIRAVAFLHSKHVMHCDIKPGNLLVSFNRSGKRKECKPRNFHLAQLVVADFGVSQVFSPVDPATFGGAATMTVTASGLTSAHGIVGTESYMAPEMLRMLRRQQKTLHHGLAGGPPVAQASEEDLVANDSFGCGCAISYLCSRGTHPFASHGNSRWSVAENILANRRLQLTKLDIVDPHHIELVDQLTRRDPKARWTVQHALLRSPIFETGSRPGQGGVAGGAEILLDALQLRQKPVGSCRDQFAALPDVISKAPSMPHMLQRVDDRVAELKAGALPPEMDDDSLVAIVAYTIDNADGGAREENVYFSLNQALRARKTDTATFRQWQGYLYFLMRALERLPKICITVYRGGNAGIDQATVRREYRIGRPIQWAAFSSTSISLPATKEFVEKKTGVIFKIGVTSGRDIGRYSFFPSESEILLSPNTRFVVTRELYKDSDGYSMVDLAESEGALFSS